MDVLQVDRFYMRIFVVQHTSGVSVILTLSACINGSRLPVHDRLQFVSYLAYIVDIVGFHHRARSMVIKSCRTTSLKPRESLNASIVSLL